MGLRLVVAEDHALVREGVVSLLDDAPGLEVTETASDLDGLLEAVDEHTPDVVVTDIRMPPTDTTEGVEAAAILSQRHPELGVVVLSQYAEPEYARALLGEGTTGRAYLLKSRVGDLDELIRAIRSVAEGGSVVDPAVVEVLLASERSGLEDLSEREREILADMAAGRSNAAIAERLVLSERTVEKHVSSIFTKLDLREERGTNRRVVAVLRWLQDGP